jgi:uncharacterized protein
VTSPSETATPRASRLARSSSAYLRSAAGQGIDWYPWGTEAFEAARRSGRPLLLDIGASWCHWCHVMDETTYADPEVARLVGEGFVAVKVDRDEHPEVDRRFQQEVGALTGEGGWPLTAFLAQDGRVFLGGTYFPPTDGHGRPGFRRVLREVARWWKDEPERIRENAEGIQEALRRLTSTAPASGSDLGGFLEGVRLGLAARYDPANGGFGAAPKFPHPIALEFLLADARQGGPSDGAERARETLARMADGGIYDQVGGGFHRYSVDEGWHIPHFEKMAIDNAELLRAYVAGARRFGDPRFEETVRGIVGWVGEVLADPDGGWGASQDADNAPGDDGNYFTWTRAELRGILEPTELRLVARVFGLGTEGRMPHDPERNVLFRLLPPEEAGRGLELPRPPGEVVRSALARLREARGRRPTPTVDRAVYASLNGRFLGSFASASEFLGDPGILEDARRAADRWLARGYAPERGVSHRLAPDGPAGHGLLDDQVAMASGLLELAVTAGEPRYLQAAEALLGVVDREFRGESGLLRDLAPALYDGPMVAGLGRPSYPLEDSPHLSANSAAALAWIRLGALRHDDGWTQKARSLVQEIARRTRGAGLFEAGAALAAGLLETEAVTVVVEGEGEAADELLHAARRTWHPQLFVFRGRPPPAFSLASELPAEAPRSEARALLCSGTSCAPPINDPATLAERISASGRAPPG